MTDHAALVAEARRIYAEAMRSSEFATEGMWRATYEVIDPPLGNYWQVTAVRSPKKAVAPFPVTKALTTDPAVAALLTFVSTALPQLCDLADQAWRPSSEATLEGVADALRKAAGFDTVTELALDAGAGSIVTLDWDVMARAAIDRLTAALTTPRAEDFKRLYSETHERWRKAEHIIWTMQYPEGDPEILRAVADEIDCGDNCSYDNYDYSCNAHECSREGEQGLGCRGFAASRLRELADAFDARKALTTPGGDGKVMWSKNHMAADPRNSCDAVDPSPSPALSREAVARIIDPWAWVDRVYRTPLGDALDRHHQQESLAKADAILALIYPAAPSPTS